jgi:hypothetical protein
MFPSNVSTGDYLDCNNPKTEYESYVVTSVSNKRDGGNSGTWVIESAESKSGGVKIGDKVKLRSLSTDGGYLCAVGPNDGYGFYDVSVTTNRPSSDEGLQWEIATPDDGMAGVQLNEITSIMLKNTSLGLPTYLVVYNYANTAPYTGGLYIAYTAGKAWADVYSTANAAWKFIKCASSNNNNNNNNNNGNNGDTGTGDGTFKLPPNMTFGVTALANSGNPQRVDVYIGNENKARATFHGQSLHDGNMGTQVLNSGPDGNVKIVVTVSGGGDGRPSKLASRQVDIQPKGGKTVYFGLLGSEDGTDNDYNDSIVILNWPLG